LAALGDIPVGLVGLVGLVGCTTRIHLRNPPDRPDSPDLPDLADGGNIDRFLEATCSADDHQSETAHSPGTIGLVRGSSPSRAITPTDTNTAMNTASLIAS
jgi:hypothetical protein